MKAFPVVLSTREECIFAASKRGRRTGEKPAELHRFGVPSDYWNIQSWGPRDKKTNVRVISLICSTSRDKDSSLPLDPSEEDNSQSCSSRNKYTGMVNAALSALHDYSFTNGNEESNIAEIDAAPVSLEPVPDSENEQIERNT